MKTLGHILLTHKDSTGTHVRVEPIEIGSVQTSASYILLDSIALGDVEISAVQSTQSIDLQDYAEPEKPKLDGVKFSMRKFRSLALVKLPWTPGTSKWRANLNDDPSQAARGETLALVPIDSTVQNLPTDTQALGLFNLNIYAVSAQDIATKRSTQLGYLVPGTDAVNWPTIAHEFKRRAKREAQELKQLESELAPTPKPNVEPEIIEPDFVRVADPDAKYVVRQLKRLNRGSFLKTVQVTDGYLVEDPGNRLSEAKKYVAEFKQDLIAKNIALEQGMEREFFPELFQ